MFRLKSFAAMGLALAALIHGGTALSSPGEAATVAHINGGRSLAEGETLHIATLNLAHGRGSALNQLLVSERKTRSNLASVGQFLQQKGIHIAALQEADAPSWWSGGFDHTTLVAQLGGFSWYTSSTHANLGVGRYGTAIVSVLPINGASSHDFPPNPPTARKGFTAAEIAWTVAGGETRLDVISIHMDFSRKSVRQTQLQELRAALAGRDNPLVIMGDFNSIEIAHQLMREEGEEGRYLHTAGDQSPPWHSYKDKRLDWILLSNELEFIEYRTYPDILSDHRLVAARVRLKELSADKEQL
jgi:endonuclease/exonuclease/phosphatase family metal-dependent hydrolase